jgi:dolichyl-phosphate-mannose--protein O-mannosyl transferase
VSPTFFLFEIVLTDEWFVVPAGDQKLYKSPFFRDFWHLNVAMMTSNNALVPDADKEDSIASGPFEWPFLYESMRMNGWGAENIKFYLTGNIIVWWGSSLSLILFVGTLFWHLARFQRKINDFAPGEWNQFLYVSKLAFGGWLLHYRQSSSHSILESQLTSLPSIVPFLIMGRVTYLHHYVRPSLLVSTSSTNEKERSIAPNSLVRSHHVRQPPRPLHLQISFPHPSYQINHLRSSCGKYCRSSDLL